PADKAGLRTGDVLETLNGIPQASFGDAQYALHRGPIKGSIPIAWQRNGKKLTGTLDVTEGWRRTNITWRPSLLDRLLGYLPQGTDLTAAEKKTLGLAEKQLAFRQEKPIFEQQRKSGVQVNDIILGIDEQVLQMDMQGFQAYLRKNYL